MNVIKFDIEIKKPRFGGKELSSVRTHIESCFQNELDFEGSFLEKLKEEWNNIEFSSVKALNSEGFLIGYSTSKNIKVFLFEKNNTGLRGKNNIALEVIAFGDLPVELILNESFFKIKKVITKLSCNHINDTRIFIFPFDSSTRDIFSYELKVRANLKNPFNIKLNEIIRWAAMFFIACIFAVMFLKIDTSTEELKQKNSAASNIYISIAGSAIFYLIGDFILYLLVPVFKRRSFRNVEITDLSSVVEAKSDLSMNHTEKLTIPE